MDFGAFHADGRGGCGFAAGGAVLRAARSLLGADYNFGDHPIIAGCGTVCFLAAFRRNGGWRLSGRDCGKLLRTSCARIRNLRIHPGIASRRDMVGSHGISVRERDAGGGAAGASDGSCMANRFSSVRRSVHRHWGSANLGYRVAGERSHTLGEKLNSPREKDAAWPSETVSDLLVNALAEMFPAKELLTTNPWPNSFSWVVLYLYSVNTEVKVQPLRRCNDIHDNAVLVPHGCAAASTREGNPSGWQLLTRYQRFVGTGDYRPSTYP